VFPSFVTLLPPFFHPCVSLLLSRVFPSLVTLLTPFFTLVSFLCYLECFPLWSPFCHLFSPLSLFCYLECFPGWSPLNLSFFFTFCHPCVPLLLPLNPCFVTLFLDLATFVSLICHLFFPLLLPCVPLLSPFLPYFATLVSHFGHPFATLVSLFCHLYVTIVSMFYYPCILLWLSFVTPLSPFHPFVTLYSCWSIFLWKYWSFGQPQFQFL
jgi:hypothetical protein